MLLVSDHDRCTECTSGVSGDSSASVSPEIFSGPSHFKAKLLSHVPFHSQFLSQSSNSQLKGFYINLFTMNDLQ